MSEEILISYIETVVAYAPTWGLLIVFVLMTIESSFIPFPSEVVMIPGGFLAARHGMALGQPLPDAALLVIAGVAGSLAGAYINYYLFSWLGKPFLDRYGKFFFLPPRKLQRAEEIFRRYGAGATFFCRLLPAIRQLISIPAGVSRMPIGSFTLWTALGAGIWMIVLTAVGYSIGAHTASMTYPELVHTGEAMIARHFPWLIPVCIVLFVVYVMITRRIMTTKTAPTRSA